MEGINLEKANGLNAHNCRGNSGGEREGKCRGLTLDRATQTTRLFYGNKFTA